MTSTLSTSQNSDSETQPLLSRTSTLNDGESLSPIKNGDQSPAISISRSIAIGSSVFVLIFTLTSNVSLMTTIQSPIAEELDASSEVTWFNSAYLIAITSLTPISGRLCQIFTPRVYLLASIIIQAFGLLLTSQSPNTSTFLAGRTICGIGSAAVTPVAFILVAQLTPPKRRGVFFGLINTGYTSGLACGAIIAGALEPKIGWRTIFWMQIPVTLTAVLVAFSMIPRPDTTESNGENENDKETITSKLLNIDFLGITTLIICLVLLLYTLSAPKISFLLVGISLFALLLFILIETKHANSPIVPPAILRSRANLLSGLSVVGIMTARWAILFYTPVYAIAVRSWAPSAAGALLVPTNLGFALGGLIVGWFHIRRTGSFYTPTLICFALFTIVQFLVAQQITSNSSLPLYIASLFANGFVVGALLNYSLAHLLHLTPTSQHVIVIPFNATFRSFSGSFGSAICGGYFLRQLSKNLHTGFKSIGMPRDQNVELVRKLLGSPLLVQKLAGDQQLVAVDAYTAALKATFLGGVGLAVVMLIVQSGVGWTTKELDQDAREGIERVLSNDAGGA